MNNGSVVKLAASDGVAREDREAVAVNGIQMVAHTGYNPREATAVRTVMNLLLSSGIHPTKFSVFDQRLPMETGRTDVSFIHMNVHRFKNLLVMFEKARLHFATGQALQMCKAVFGEYELYAKGADYDSARPGAMQTEAVLRGVIYLPTGRYLFHFKAKDMESFATPLKKELVWFSHERPIDIDQVANGQIPVTWVHECGQGFA